MEENEPILPSGAAEDPDSPVAVDLTETDLATPGETSDPVAHPSVPEPTEAASAKAPDAVVSEDPDAPVTIEEADTAPTAPRDQPSPTEHGETPNAKAPDAVISEDPDAPVTVEDSDPVDTSAIPNPDLETLDDLPASDPAEQLSAPEHPHKSSAEAPHPDAPVTIEDSDPEPSATEDPGVSNAPLLVDQLSTPEHAETSTDEAPDPDAPATTQDSDPSPTTEHLEDPTEQGEFLDLQQTLSPPPPDPVTAITPEQLLMDARPAADEEGGEAHLLALLEAVVYVTDEPLTLEQIAHALNQPQPAVKLLLDKLVDEFNKPHHGLTLREVAGGFKMATKPEHHEAVRTFVKNLNPPLKLSLAALETLAVIAYKQPVTAPEIMEIRGVQGAGVLKTLLDRKLIGTAGRKNVVGKPILYKTTKEFLVQFGLKDLNELPTLKEFEDLRRMAFSDDVTESVGPEPETEPEPAKQEGEENVSE